jgi:molybdopterin converting factor small subunit
MIKVRRYAEYRDLIGKNEIEIPCKEMTFKEIVDYLSSNYNNEFSKSAISNGKINEYMLVMADDRMISSIDEKIKEGETLKILATAHGG